ncbi:MAG: iron ABC transporter permease [Planctomycetota bacterium]|nr:iron ABC transporter permease [Planctomycetota bacterium]
MTQPNRNPESQGAPPRPRGNRLRVPAALLGLLLVVLVVAAVRLCAGPDAMGWPGGEFADVILRERVRNIAAAVIVGAALSVSGVSLQVLLRNPLAEPFILGLSTGAGVGVMAQTALAYRLGLQYGSNSIGALVGAIVTMLVVYGASRRRGVVDPLGLLLVGVVLSTVNGAVIMLVNYLAGPGGMKEDLSRWMMGYLRADVSEGVLMVVGVVTLAGVALAAALGRSMDVATFSDSEAESLGVHLGRLRATLFVVASALAAGSVVLAGPVAFVGLICPHAARLLLGPRHGPLVIGAALAGAALIVLADIASIRLGASLNAGVMPIGIFTAMLGGPAFLWMLRPQLGRGQE